MFKTILYWIRTVMQMFRKSDVAQAAGVEAQLTDAMAGALTLWDEMYRNAAPWVGGDVISLELPATIAAEFARLVTVEHSAIISGSARADWLNGQYTAAMSDLQAQVEYGLALGGIAFKPYITGDNLAVDFTPADRFLPTAFDGGRNITGGVFIDRFTKGKWFYTRFEHHDLAAGRYTIRNIAYMSNSQEMLGTQVPLAEVEPWAGLEDEVTLQGIARPLFGYFRVPTANNIDRASPLGVSVYSRAANLIRQADQHWSRIMWELEGTELAVDISDQAFRLDPVTGSPILPERKERLFRPSGIGTPEKPLYEIFSPDVRVSPYFDALNGILRRIEFNCGLAYGTLSDPQTVDKTAEEIRSSRQRSYSAVCAMQRSLQRALDGLVYAMDVWATIGKLASKGKYETTFAWGDGVNDDPDKEFAQRMQLVAAGIDRPDEMRQWYHGESEGDAKKNLPDMTGLLEG